MSKTDELLPHYRVSRVAMNPNLKNMLKWCAVGLAVAIAVVCVIGLIFGQNAATNAVDYIFFGGFIAFCAWGLWCNATGRV